LRQASDVAQTSLQVTVWRKVEDGEIFLAKSEPPPIAFAGIKRPRVTEFDSINVGQRREFELALDQDRSEPQSWRCKIESGDSLIRVDADGCSAIVDGASEGDSSLHISIVTPAGDVLPFDPIVETTQRMLEVLPDGRKRSEVAYDAVSKLERRAEQFGTYSALMSFGLPGSDEEVCSNTGGVRRIVSIGAHGGAGSLTGNFPAPDPASAYGSQLDAWLAAAIDYQAFKQKSITRSWSLCPL
jgi:hypothetical protein